MGKVSCYCTNSLAPDDSVTLRGVVVLALLPQHGVSDLLQGRVQAPAAWLILRRRVDGLLLQQFRCGASQSGVPLQGPLQEGAHGQAAVFCYVLQGRGLLVDLLGRLFFSV